MYREPYSHNSTYYFRPSYYGNYYNPGEQQYKSYPPYYDYDPETYQTPFEYYAKPNQPENWPESMHQPPYPMNPSKTSPGLLTYFQDGNGQVDFDKMLSTVGQLANTVQQVSPAIQQISSMIKSFR